MNDVSSIRLDLTSTLIAESRKIVEAAHSDTLEPNVLLNMILQIVTFILDSKTRMRWCKHSIFSLWLRSAFDSLGFSSSFLSL
jgi:hypothetical protein